MDKDYANFYLKSGQEFLTHVLVPKGKWVIEINQYGDYSKDAGSKIRFLCSGADKDGTLIYNED